ncbi:TonB-dependent receptor [Phaeocystidibacter marisrubri]|uniref:TonB-dependent receptor n=1 Tax=Phaeocystidibacter marisrubri TaxID=1577780 RepID=A0A6L3ZF73_9FLAO|nr:TonB-dependent receptor [Phaeocystidibacter marisrubri]KAB2816067.1 TonB-dependent receptor [Phaeocystidibacter marisrubri]
MKHLLLMSVLTLSPLFLFSQAYSISGTVEDATTGESLIGAYVKDLDGNGVAATNPYGFYSMNVDAGRHRISVSILGYKTDTLTVNVSSNVKLNFQMRPATEEIGEVVVTGERANENIKSVEMSVTTLSTKEIQKIPQLLGETDIVRSLTLLPGVTTVGEGASGFNVRGGNVDQNLILLDEAPVFNSSHLFGFFSVFNADAVKDVKLFKGGIPSMYGGRLSSVLDVRQKEGNSKEFAGNGGIGLLSSRLTLEGPIIEDKMSFMVAGRRSYMDIFLPLFNDDDLDGTTLYFYDLNAKLNYRFSDRSRLFASAYFGRDVLGFNDLFSFGWGNVTTTLRWNYLINDKLFMNLTGVYSDYTYNIGTPEDQVNNFNLDSRIQNYIQNGNFTWYASNHHKVDFGYNVTNYVFSPGEITGFINTSMQREFAIESAVYISDEWNITDQWTLLAGLRYSGITNYGPREIVNYDPNAPTRENSAIVDTTFYPKNGIIASYYGLDGFEPRLALNYTIDETQSLKLSYNRTRQYIHLISNTTSPTPVDVWRPSGKYIQPATADQIAIGYFKNLFDNSIKVSVEAYYKYFDNLVDYKDGADLIFQDNIETELLTGVGRAYGLELMIEKKSGWLTGWISYTLARSERQVAGEIRETTINNGDWYKANFDKPHDFSLVANARLSDTWDIGLNFAYQTGRPVTYPDGLANYQGVPYPIYTNRNGARIPDYHRLDISATYVMKKTEKWEHSLTFGVYNVYGRRNPYSIFFQQDLDTGKPQAMQLSIFAAPIPFITYNFNF